MNEDKTTSFESYMDMNINERPSCNMEQLLRLLY